MFFRVMMSIDASMEKKNIYAASAEYNRGSGATRVCVHNIADGKIDFLVNIPFKKLKNRRSILFSFISAVSAPVSGKAVWKELDGPGFMMLAEESRKARYICFVEDIIPGRKAQKRCQFISDSLVPSKGKTGVFSKGSLTLEEEVSRIRKSKTRGFFGHPVHYVFLMDSMRAVDESLFVLLNALHRKGRLISRRVMRVFVPEVTDVDIFSEGAGYVSSALAAYKSVEGGTVVLYAEGQREEKGVLTSADVDMDDIAGILKADHTNVLSVVVLPRSSSSAAAALMNEVPNMRFVVINERDIPRKDVRDVFLNLSRKNGVRKYVDSFMMSVPEAVFSLSEVEEMYSLWYRNLLDRELYPEYGSIEGIRIGISEDKGNAYSRLHSLIGLESVKEVIDEAVDLNKYNQILLSRNRKRIDVSRHMVFTGNPGTAKTTVARLFASIMKENGVLSRGELIEVGRQDIVAKYVGWTATNVQNIFQRAKGSVLFIDEAYSLIDDRDGSFGDEAINAIVQCMENQRDDTIVIFAGYPDKMEAFLRRNPGLRSRISRVVQFDDYTPHELYEILCLMCSQDGTAMDEDVGDKVLEIFDEAREKADFGNGRFVRNLYETARTRAVRRMMKSGIADDIILKAEDFVLLQTSADRERKRAIGFGY